MKNLKTKIIISLVLFSTVMFFVLPKDVEAEVEDGNCNPEYLIYQQADHWWDLDIRRIVGNMITSVFVSMYANVNGVTLTDLIGCEKYMESRGLSFLPDEVEACQSLSNADCEVLVNRVRTGGSGSTGSNIAESNVSKSVRGSILGIAYSLENFNRKEPLMVNLAYFWNRSIARVPFVNKTLAAPLSVEKYNMPLLTAMFDLWRLVRNVSLGLISVVLLYTGILIIMRKKVNPQLVVTIQYAIPKIFIGLLLIIFSYPIGAAIIAVSWGVFRGGFDIVMGFYPRLGGAVSMGGGGITAGEVFAAIQQAQLRYGMGFGVLLMTVAISILCNVLWLVVNIKAAFIYLKMILAVVTAPFEMAIGTVPGSEARITDWFKRMAKHGLSIMAMGFAVPAVVIIGYETLVAYSTANAETSGWGGIMRVFVPLGVVVYGFIVALSIDKTIAGFFGDDKKKK